MSVWYAIPSARPIAEAKACFDAWKKIGCRVAATRKDPDDHRRLGLDLCLSLPKYLGYYAHINILAKAILERDPACTIVATGGDDVMCDPDMLADRIEREFLEHFGGTTLGVLQPTGGKPWSKGVVNGMRVQERLAWAPWLGREWCIRGHGGRGPFWPYYGHFYGDQELFDVANKLGVWCARPDIKQQHFNWKVVGDGKRPKFLEAAQQGWDQDKGIYFARQAAGFPGHELLSCPS